MWTIMNSPLNLYSALEKIKYFQRHSLSLSLFLSSWLREFSLDSIHNHSFWQILLPPHPPKPTHSLPLSQRPRLPSGSLTPWLVLSLLSPPGYNHRLFIYSLYHLLHQEQVSPRKMLWRCCWWAHWLANRLLHEWPMKYPLQSARLTHFLWWFAYLFIVCPLLKVLPTKSL